MNDEELEEYLKALIEAAVTIAENVESIAGVLVRAENRGDLDSEVSNDR